MGYIRNQFARFLPMEKFPDYEDQQRINHNTEEWDESDLPTMYRSPFTKNQCDNQPACRKRQSNHVSNDFGYFRTLPTSTWRMQARKHKDKHRAGGHNRDGIHDGEKKTTSRVERLAHIQPAVPYPRPNGLAAVVQKFTESFPPPSQFPALRRCKPWPARTSSYVASTRRAA